MQNKLVRTLFSAVLLAALALSIATPALAFDGRGGDTITIGKDEIVNDDLYVGAETVTLDGTVKGDFVAAGSIVTINGTVEGDLIAAGQAVILNGTVTDDVRIAGGALLIGENAVIGGDLVAAGASIEIRAGSTIGTDVIGMGGQALVAADVTRNVQFTGGGLELRGQIGGDVNAIVGDAEETGPGPMVYMPNSPIALPNVKPGLTISPEAKIGGKLEYTSTKDLNIPAEVVVGPVTRIEPKVEPEMVVKEPTPAERVMTGVFDTLRNMVSLILIGLLLVWLFPGFLAANVSKVRSAALPAFGWGLVSWAAFFFAILLLIVAMVIGAIFFGVLTLGSLSGTIVFFGLLAMFVLIFGFVLASSFVAQIVVSALGGKLILEKLSPSLADHKFWPMLLGVVLFALLGAIPVLGGLIQIVVGLLGLGALWMYGRDLFNRPKMTDQPVG